MCELLGLNFNAEVTVQLAFSGLKAGATENPDGWGVAWYDEFGTQIIKEAKPVDRSRLATSFLEELGARSRIFVSHIRRATAGAAGYPNTHPFYRRFDKRTWVFAHNGTVDPHQLDLSSGKVRPIGETDSEVIFCHLLSWLEENTIALDDRDDFVLLHNKLLEINRSGELNVIFSDGRALFTYHDCSGHVGLHHLLRQAPYKVVRLRGQYLTVDLSNVVDPAERGYIVASMPLSDEDWIKVKEGQLLVFSEGHCIFSSEN
jgi:predicted glutamine amidotransferase